MLKLLIYAPCEKVIISDDQTASIISVMETVNVNVAAEIPPDALAPLRWNIISLWRKDEEISDPIEIEERTDVLRPDGSVATGGTTKFTVTTEHLMYRTLLQLAIFPIGQQGIIKMKCRIRQVNPETEWTDFAEFPVLVTHQPVQIETTSPVAVAEAVPQAAKMD